MTPGLIFDIGANDGRDTAFYLAKGFRVVAVEADPTLAARLGADHAAAIADGRLVVENIGIGGQSAELPFYVNDFSEWSSFRAGSKATTQGAHRVITVQMHPLSWLIARHGVPYYLKLDIEGHEAAALSSLDPAAGLPPWLSFERNADWSRIVDRLSGWGYGGFQLVRQGAQFLAPPPTPPREGAAVAVRFTNGHSGCFGRDLPDLWLDAAALRARMDDEDAAIRARVARGEPGGWFDIHARR